MDRRAFIGSAGAALSVAALHPTASGIVAAPPIRAVAFDGYGVFDPTAVIAVAEAVLPGKGRDFVAAWRARMFDYQWLRTLGGRYVDFAQTAGDSLSFTLKALALSVRAEDRDRMLDAQLTLTPWADAAAQIARMRRAGLRLAFLSNMTERMLDDGARRAGLRDQFELVLSTDRVRAAKPDPRAYRMAVDAFGLHPDEIAFVAFAGWDAAGATWFGYPTAWLNRSAQPVEELDATPRAVCGNLSDVAEFVTKRAG
jgi:2-haloacid dehalogenase